MRIIASLLVLASTLAAQQPEDPMVRADQLFQERANVESLKQAISAYEGIVQQDAKSYEASWRLSRCYYFLVMNTADKKQKQVIAQKGIDIAMKAVAIDQKRADGHFWLGVNYGVFGEAKGVLKSLSLVGPIKQEMAAALRADPNCEGGGPDRVLGRLYYRLPWIVGGSDKKSLEYLLHSQQLTPTNTLTKLYLADTYWALGQKDKARKELNEILTIQPDPRWVPELDRDRRSAQRRIDAIARGKDPTDVED